MWLVTDRGFYSCAVDKDAPSRIMVRARLRADLERLRLVNTATLPTWDIEHTPEADYPYRAFILRREFADIVSGMVLSMGYTSFTGSVEEKMGKARRDLNKRAWAIFAELDERVRVVRDLTVEQEAELHERLGSTRASQIKMRAPDLHEAARQVALNIKILRDGGPLGDYERDVLERVEYDYLPAIK